jgi:hypothetical protein
LANQRTPEGLPADSDRRNDTKPCDYDAFFHFRVTLRRLLEQKAGVALQEWSESIRRVPFVAIKPTDPNSQKLGFTAPSAWICSSEYPRKVHIAITLITKQRKKIKKKHLYYYCFSILFLEDYRIYFSFSSFGLNVHFGTIRFFTLQIFVEPPICPGLLGEKGILELEFAQAPNGAEGFLISLSMESVNPNDFTRRFVELGRSPRWSQNPVLNSPASPPDRFPRPYLAKRARIV